MAHSKQAGRTHFPRVERAAPLYATLRVEISRLRTKRRWRISRRLRRSDGVSLNLRTREADLRHSPDTMRTYCCRAATMHMWPTARTAFGGGIRFKYLNPGSLECAYSSLSTGLNGSRRACRSRKLVLAALFFCWGRAQSGCARRGSAAGANRRSVSLLTTA